MGEKVCRKCKGPMTQTHRGGGVGGISESYCPKCDVSKAFRTGWAVVKGHPHGTDPKTGKGKVGTWNCNRCGLPQGPSRNRACANPDCIPKGGA